MHFIYLHGFNSAYKPDSDKVLHLSKIGSVSGITYNTFATYDEIHENISSQISHNDDLVFVGTSLGGFWASEMGRRFCVPSIIINPCIDPHNMLRKYVSVEQINYLTGEKNTLTDVSVCSYPRHDISQNDYTYIPLCLLDTDDEVIDSWETKNKLSRFPKMCHSGGSHRFDHMEESLEEIKRYTNRCSFVDQANM